MLGIGTPELIVIGLIILIFYGPDRLPTLLTKASRIFRDIKHATHGVRQQVNREIAKIESDVIRLEEDPSHVAQGDASVLQSEDKVSTKTPIEKSDDNQS